MTLRLRPLSVFSRVLLVFVSLSEYIVSCLLPSAGSDRSWSRSRLFELRSSSATGEVLPGQQMMDLALSNTPFSCVEVEKVVRSLQQLAGGTDKNIDWESFRHLLARTAHLPYKNWAQTEQAADELHEIIGGPCDPCFQTMFQRLLRDGNWVGGLEHSACLMSGEVKKPWVVLVTGLNGIRKTTSIYQPWFKSCLAEALGPGIPTEGEGGVGGTGEVSDPALPAGEDSFFRQLDYMIATLAAEDFAVLYSLAANGCGVDEYSAAKASIFSRYRTLAEMLGVLLVKEAKRKGINVMVETSGRDLASYHYIDHLFPDDTKSRDDEAEPKTDFDFQKLVVHFTVNDLRYAESSVDVRMAGEMEAGAKILRESAVAPLSVRDGSDTLGGQGDTGAVGDESPVVVSTALVGVNAGGPYGSSVLSGVQADSNRVWSQVSSPPEGTFPTWRKARVAITASDSAPWTARAAPLGTAAESIKTDVHTFEPVSS